MSNLPEKIGKYEIIGVAGRGNMGVVYSAHDPFTDRPVAVKVCSIDTESTAASSRIARKLFFNEAHTAGRLYHPNILSVYDAGEEGGEPYIVMEYVEGARTLRQHCDPETLLPVKAVVEVIYKCAKALDYAHRRGVIHRDVKPSNIMLTPDGDVKIGDFGIAQGTQSDTTQVMGMMGSPRYMSPEQAQEDAVTNQTDLFSLGVVLFELLCGKTPFQAKSFSRLIYTIIHDDPPPVRQLRPDVPPTLEQVVARTLAKDLSTRYRMGAELASELAFIFGDLEEPVQALSEKEKFEVVRELRFFNEFSDAEVWEVIRAAVWEEHAAGEEIITEGHLEHSLYILVSGEVAVVKDGKEIGLLAKGDCFGEMGYLSKNKRSASIRVRDRVNLLKINDTLMDQASITCQLRFNKVFLHTLIERLARTSEYLARFVASV